MSNIQITENGPGKYSPEWFYSESQTPEWISFAHKADELRENFINLFGIERLKSLFGKDLLTSLFYNDEGTKTNLCYRLEMDKDIREVFGSISGGAAYKFGLFYHKKNQSWTCGSPLKPIHLTEDEAIQKAEEMRNDLVEGAEIISSFGPLDSEKDYEQLYKQLEHIPGINMVWRMKYYQMLFPTLFAPFYGQDIQLRVLHFLNQKPGEEWNPKKMKKYVKHAYFVIQECWRRQDTSYAEKYLSKNLIQNWNSKLGWMEVNHEKPVQERVRFLNAAPVFAFDKEGEEHDRVIYLIHGRMIGYYINIDTGEVVRGKTSPETFYEYWVFIREDGRWVLDEIRQKDEVDVERL